MTPLDKARDAMAAVEKATAGEWYQPDGADGHIWNNDAEPGEGYTPDRVIFEGPIQPQWAKDRKPDEWYGENERNLAAAAAAVNFVRNDLHAVIAEVERLGSLARANNDLAKSLEGVVKAKRAEHERMADRVAKLEAGYNDAVAGLCYIEQHHGRLYGVGWDRVFDAHAALNDRALLTPDNGADDGR